jgi:hypothetical protein
MIGDLEAKKGSPVNMVEFRKEFLANPGYFTALLPAERSVMYSVFQSNKIYLDK